MLVTVIGLVILGWPTEVMWQPTTPQGGHLNIAPGCWYWTTVILLTNDSMSLGMTAMQVALWTYQNIKETPIGTPLSLSLTL